MPADPKLADELEDYADRWPTLSEDERAVAFVLLVRLVVRLDHRAGALVQASEGKNGEVIYVAKRTRLSASSIATLVAAFGAAFTPIIIALLNR